MKYLPLLLLAFLAVLSVAEDRVVGLIPLSPGADSQSESAIVKGEGRREARRRELKGGKGGKGGGSSKGSKGSSDCETLSIRIVTGSIQDNAVNSEFGYATRVDVFQGGTRSVIASWYEQASYTNLAFTDGVGTGILVWPGGRSSISFGGSL
jgi:hypothetical protein